MTEQRQKMMLEHRSDDIIRYPNKEPYSLILGYVRFICDNMLGDSFDYCKIRVIS